MSSSKRIFSLPKTQPTLNSSSKSKIKTQNKTLNKQTETFPYVTDFMTEPNDQRYTHNMRIDYGKLMKPFKQELKQEILNQLSLSNDLNSLLSTRKFKNLKQFTQDQGTNQDIQPPIHSLLTQKKPFSAQRLMKNIKNPQSGDKICKQKQTHKKKNRIISVKAYQLTNRQRQEQNQWNQSKLKSKQNFKQPQSMSSSRKISHSRIIKTFNPTAGIQTKIITYPDLSDLIKIRQNRNK